MTAFVHSRSAYHAISFRPLTVYGLIIEPGGYLQWDESDPDTSIARSPRPEVSNKACGELLALITRFSKMFGMHTESVPPGSRIA